ncbi:serine/arginine-rich splicing factor 4, putative (SRSF4) [Plasmodium ovale curtisi]|uniref:Serine/arginine-rich splicing factor 4, putative (SRSF4) n=1 Tax=Plasmodium ovale curtisi TaxID=864141 RepID=A0A1A8W8E2_PLAOA|nr:serine/arginine-rich splicing factor 4, putative (SRSF4) [Plasmodium ovale curtisi]
MGYRSSRYRTSCIYVGNLPGNVLEDEVYDLFGKYGRIKYIDIKLTRGSSSTAYAFVHYYDIKDAEYAIERKDGYKFDGERLRVEFSGENKSFGKYRRKEDGIGPPLRTEHRIIVSNLPDNCKWQHLKDIMRQCGDVGYANIEHGKGIVEFVDRDGMLYAIEKFDRAEFKVHDQVTNIKVRRDKRSLSYIKKHRSDYYSPRHKKKRIYSDESESNRSRRRSKYSSSSSKGHSKSETDSNSSYDKKERKKDKNKNKRSYSSDGKGDDKYSRSESSNSLSDDRTYKKKKKNYSTSSDRSSKGSRYNSEKRSRQSKSHSKSGSEYKSRSISEDISNNEKQSAGKNVKRENSLSAEKEGKQDHTESPKSGYNSTASEVKKDDNEDKNDEVDESKKNEKSSAAPRGRKAATKRKPKAGKAKKGKNENKSENEDLKSVSNDGNKSDANKSVDKENNDNSVNQTEETKPKRGRRGRKKANPEEN